MTYYTVPLTAVRCIMYWEYRTIQCRVSVVSTVRCPISDVVTPLTNYQKRPQTDQSRITMRRPAKIKLVILAFVAVLSIVVSFNGYAPCLWKEGV
jgi:hypothetical protein